MPGCSSWPIGWLADLGHARVIGWLAAWLPGQLADLFVSCTTIQTRTEIDSRVKYCGKHGLTKASKYSDKEISYHIEVGEGGHKLYRKERKDREALSSDEEGLTWDIEHGGHGQKPKTEGEPDNTPGKLDGTAASMQAISFYHNEILEEQGKVMGALHCRAMDGSFSGS